MTKAEVYKMVIEHHKKFGDGLPGIVKLGKDYTIEDHLEELVEEGLLKIHDNGEAKTLGHPFTSQFYIPTEGYDVFKDGLDEHNSDIAFLSHIRLYLGCLEENEDREDINKWINPTSRMLIQNVDFMKGYSVWLERNQQELEILKNLDENYLGEIYFTDEEIETIKSKKWYKENKTISECYKTSKEVMDGKKEYIANRYRAIEIYQELIEQHGEDRSDDIKETRLEIEKRERDSIFRKKLHKFFDKQEPVSKIKDVI